MLREKNIIESDFDINFEVEDGTNVKCPEYINETILNVKSEAIDFIYPSILFQNETTWECAANERLSIGYVNNFFRLMAYSMSNQDEERKVEEREKFMSILKRANEISVNCFLDGFEKL
jgi:hypothetical protein